MEPKKEKNTRDSVNRRRVTVELKKEIVAKYENGERMSHIARQYNMAKSTICTILKRKEMIKMANVAKGVTVITKQRSKLAEEVEKLLLVWIKERQIAGDSITGAIICEKARQLHADLLASLPGTSAEGEHFKASRGWFEKFRRRSGIQSVVIHGEAAGSHKVEFVNEFTKFVKSEGFYPYQVFNCGETGLFWNIVPKRTYITKEEEEEEVDQEAPPWHNSHKQLDCSVVDELEEDYEGEITTDLVELQYGMPENEQEEYFPEEKFKEEINVEQLREICTKWRHVKDFVRKYHPDRVVVDRAVEIFEDNVMSYFHEILKKRKKELSPWKKCKENIKIQN